MSLLSTKQMWPSGIAFVDSQAVAADTALIAAVAGKRIVIDSIFASCGTAVGTFFLEHGSTAMTPSFHLGVSGNMSLYDVSIAAPVGVAVTYTTAGAASVQSILVRYHLEG